MNGEILYDYNLEKIRDLKEVLAFKIFSKVGRPLSVPEDGPSRHFALALTTSKGDEIKDITEYIINNCFNVK